MNRLRQLRHAKGLTLQQVADQAKTSPQQIRRLEVGERRLAENWMRRLAPILGVSPSEMLGEEQPRGPMPEALKEFLRSPDGKTATQIEVDELRRLRARGARPTADTYFWALKMLRSMEADK